MTVLARAEVELGGNLAPLHRALDGAAQAMERAGQRLSEIGSHFSTRITLPLLGVGVAAAKATADFETAMVGVAKTVDAPQDAIDALGRRFVALSEAIPVAATELAGIAEEAGQLGVAFGAIPEFTQVVAGLRVATDLGSTAASSLARLALVTGTAQTEFDRLASTIVALGNQGASTEAEIADMALRIGGAGQQIGLTAAETLAFASALSSLGLRSEAGGTAISRVFSDMALAVAQGGERFNEFARVAGMTGDQFREAFQRDAAGAVISFIEGLGRLSSAGENAFAILEGVELADVRVRDALLRAAGASDVLKNAIALANTEWEANTALTNEASRFYDRLAADFTRLFNKARNVTAELGDALRPAIDVVIRSGNGLLNIARKLIQRFAALTPQTRIQAVAIAAVAAAVGPAVIALGSLIRIVGFAAGGLAVFTTAATTCATVLSGGFTVAVTLASGAVGLLTRAISVAAVASLALLIRTVGIAAVALRGLSVAATVSATVMSGVFAVAARAGSLAVALFTRTTAIGTVAVRVFTGATAFGATVMSGVFAAAARIGAASMALFTRAAALGTVVLRGLTAAFATARAFVALAVSVRSFSAAVALAQIALGGVTALLGGPVVAVLGGVAVAIGVVAAAWDDVGAFAARAFRVALDVAGTVLSTIGTVARAVINGIVGTFAFLGRVAVIVFEEFIQEPFESAFDFIAEKAKFVLNAIAKGFELLGKLGKGAADAIRGFFSDAAEGADDEGASLGSRIAQAALDSFGTDYVGAFVDLVSGAVRKARDLVARAINALRNMAGGAAVVPGLEELDGILANLNLDPPGGGEEAPQSKWKALAGTVEGVASAFTDALGGAIDDVRDAFGRFIDFAIRELVALAARFAVFKAALGIFGAGPLGKLFGGTFLGFDIPGFASGGFLRPGEVGVVGERGPELVTAGPQGLSVMSTEQSAAAMRPIVIDISRMPPALNRLEAARDGEWVRFLAESLRNAADAGAISPSVVTG